MIENYNKKQNPFKVPENYFENFNKEIMAKLPERTKEQTKVIPLRRRVLSWTAAAAILVVALISGSVLWNNSSNGNSNLTNTATYSETLEEYYESMEAKSIESTYQEIFYSEYGYY